MVARTFHGPQVASSSNFSEHAKSLNFCEILWFKNLEPNSKLEKQRHHCFLKTKAAGLPPIVKPLYFKNQCRKVRPKKLKYLRLNRSVSDGVRARSLISKGKLYEEKCIPLPPPCFCLCFSHLQVTSQPNLGKAEKCLLHPAAAAFVKHL